MDAGEFGPHLPNGWVACTIGDVTEPVEKAEPRDNPRRLIKYLDISGIDNEKNRVAASKSFSFAEAPSRARQVVRRGDVLFSTVRPYLRNIASVPAEFDGEIASTGFSVLRGAPGIEPKFLFYKAVSREFVDALSAEQYGVSYPAVKDSQVRAQPLLLPPTEEQHRIVEKIETLFARLDKGDEAVRQVQALLKRYRQSVLKAAVTGDLTADWREANRDRLEHGRDLLARILKTRREAWKGPGRYKEPAGLAESRLPPVPTGWVWARVDVVGDVLLGRQRAPQYHRGELMRPYLRVANVFEDRLDLSDVKSMHFDEEHFLKYQLQSGDILLNEGQTPDLVGRPAMFNGEIEGCCFQKTLHRFRASPHMDRRFALIVFRAYLHSGRFKKSSSITTNIAHLPLGRFCEIEFPVPSLDEQREIVSRVDQELSLASGMENSLREVVTFGGALRQSILKQAFSGRLVPQDPSDEPASALLARIRAAGPAEKKRKTAA